MGKKLILLFGLCLMLLPCVSIFLWAGFDFTWWASMNGDLDRQLTLSLMHLGVAAIGVLICGSVLEQ